MTAEGGQNDHTTLEETIFTIGIGTVPEIAKLLVERVRADHPGKEIPD